MDFLKLTNDVLSVDHILKEVSSETCGAVSIFIGTTRDNFERKKVMQLEYEAYDAMALKVMKSICGDIRKEWTDVHHIAIYHRLGTVPVLEASVVIAISSPHRIDAMDAVKYCIEHLKEGGLSIPSDSQQKSDNLTHQFTIDPKIIQVNASNDEIQRRIKNYIDRKREQINLCNIQDFITNKGDNKEISETSESTCARIDAVLVKRKDSKGHLSVMRVQNEWGPQTKVPKREPDLINKDSQHHPKGAINERLSNVETHLNVAKPISSDIYSRLKKIEDRILELESISPEYVMFWSKNSQHSSCDNTSTDPKSHRTPKKFKYTSDEIKRKLEAMESA